MPTLVLSPRVTPDSIRVWRAAISQGWDVLRLSSWRFETKPPISPVIYAEPLFVSAIAEKLGIVPVEPSLDWTVRLAPKWRGRKMRLTTLGEARKELMPIFVKPAEDKSFLAKVYKRGSYLPTLGLPYPNDLQVVVSEPVDFAVEYRCFIRNKKVATASIYLRDGRIADDDSGSWAADPGELQEAVTFAEAVMQDSSTPPLAACVLDVGCIRGSSTFVVVESNAAWGAGLCGCDEVKVLDVLHLACPGRLRGQTKLVSLVDDKLGWDT